MAGVCLGLITLIARTTFLTGEHAHRAALAGVLGNRAPVPVAERDDRNL